MKTHLLRLSALVPMAALSLFSLAAPPSAASQAPAPPKPSPAQQVTEARQKLEEIQKNTALAQAKLEENRKKLDASLAKLNETLTPEKQRAGVEATMRTREPHYRTLFESWKLDAATSDLAIAVIHYREIKLVEQRIPLFQKGMAGAAEYQQGSKTARDNAEAQLRILLGAEHFGALTQFETQLAAESKARAAEIMSKRSAETKVTASLTVEDSQKKVDVAFARLNETFTPDKQRTAVDTSMRMREPRYRALFDSWKLDLATADLAIAVIHHREKKLVEQRIPFFQKGMAGAPDYMKGSKAARDDAEAQLRILLGPEHLDEVTKLEAQLVDEGKARAEDYMRNRPKESK